ncbi:unnamed protein product [Vitrella brassicaformis CCMP3155]|uniref:Uncharacterized protein n=1 Tax=Vitrella brassicaformis (strain CCMP3155) TaxID=1169540 RepID=A0A0G4GUJ5_VITBC|nr:unnamed protein product [Vitrella brassicaformis CCMP3155]|eukprot:CEM34231.1 unnamed protein product [Vitrella brassicaformis CCMP3155]
MRNLFCCILAESDVAAHMEVYLQNLDVTPPDNDPNSQRMDIYCAIGGQGSLLDVTITHPCPPDASPFCSHRDVSRRSAQLLGWKVFAEKAKTTKTFSSWAPAMLAFLKTLAKRRPALRPSQHPKTYLPERASSIIGASFCPWS